MAGGSGPAWRDMGEKLTLYIGKMMCSDVPARDQRITAVAVQAWTRLLDQGFAPDWESEETFNWLAERAYEIMDDDDIWCGPTY